MFKIGRFTFIKHSDDELWIRTDDGEALCLNLESIERIFAEEDV